MLQNKDILQKSLQDIGLTENEASVYGVLLATSPSSASHIAKKTGLPRSSVYTLINTLIGKGLVGTTFKNEVKQFVAEDTSTIGEMLVSEKKALEKRFSEFEKLKSIMPDMPQPAANIPGTVFFEGQEGLKKIYLSMMRKAKNNSTMYLIRDEFVWRPEWKFIFEKDWRDRVRRIKDEKNISTRLLVNSSKLEKEKNAFYKSKKDLKHGYLKRVVKDFAIYMMDDEVSIMSMEKNNLVGIKVINKNITENFKTLFESL